MVQGKSILESYNSRYEKGCHSPFGSSHIHSLSFLLNFISFKISISVLSILFIFLINHTSKIITIAGSVNKYNEMVNVDGVINAGYKNIAPSSLSLLIRFDEEIFRRIIEKVKVQSMVEAVFVFKTGVE